MSTSTSDLSAMSKAVNENDKGALITLAAALGLGFSLFFLLFRLYTRRPIREMYKIDDTATTIATVSLKTFGFVVVLETHQHPSLVPRQPKTNIFFFRY